jgi:hypothetical protein
VFQSRAGLGVVAALPLEAELALVPALLDVPHQLDAELVGVDLPRRVNSVPEWASA